jgi:chemotaxis protein MotB
MENEKKPKIKKDVEDASALLRVEMEKQMRQADAGLSQEAVIIDIEKAVGPRNSFLTAGQPPLNIDYYNEEFLDPDETITPPHWAVPWSDIMMVVFVMFAVLFIYSASKRDIAEAFKNPTTIKTAAVKHEKVTEVTPEATHEKLQELSQTITRHTIPDQVSVVIEKNQPIKVSAGDSLFFDLGKADIKPEGIKFLRDFADIIKNSKSNIRIEGHTDSFPIHSPVFPTNWELSVIRAVNITRFLIEETGLEPERFTVVGHSLYKPAAPDLSSGNKAKNRRVEIYIENESPTEAQQRRIP